MKKMSFIFLALILSTALYAGGSREEPSVQERLKLATTTSTDNTGLLDTLLPAFTEQTGYEIDVIAVGTGKAIAHGEDGDVDVILVHARGREDSFVADGFGVDRRDVMYNDFVLLGPESDPASVQKFPSLEAALQAIHATESYFISRGDDSGTNIKELAAWDRAGITPEGAWYKEAGQGMGAVITIADELEGYTLTDRGTYLAMADAINLTILYEGDDFLFNPYGIIAVNPEMHAYVNYEGASALIDFITSKAGQQIIADFKVNGEQLFFPNPE